MAIEGVEVVSLEGLGHPLAHFFAGSTSTMAVSRSRRSCAGRNEYRTSRLRISATSAIDSRYERTVARAAAEEGEG